MNKARGDDGIPVELFQILKDDAVNVLNSICPPEDSLQSSADGHLDCFYLLAVGSNVAMNRTSLVVQRLRLCAPNERAGLGSIPGQGTRSCMPQLRPSAAK